MKTKKQKCIQLNNETATRRWRWVWEDGEENKQNKLVQFYKSYDSFLLQLGSFVNFLISYLTTHTLCFIRDYK